MAAKNAPIAIGEKTATQIREAETLREQARAMYGQAEARINAIVTAVREARDLPDSWQIVLMGDGKFYMKDTTETAESAPEPEPSPA